MRATYSDIKRKAELLNSKARAVQNSKLYERVVGILSGLGFLIAPGVVPLPQSKVDFEDALEIGLNIEPRVLEVLPAAVLSFPGSFRHFEKAPDGFKQIVQALKSGKEGPDFHGITFSKFFEAANRPIRNRKRKVVTERRISKTFRFSPNTIQSMIRRAREKNLDYTMYIEQLIEQDEGGSFTSIIRGV